MIPFMSTVEPITEMKQSAKHKEKVYIEHIKTFKQLLNNMEHIYVRLSNW